jgi:hypothetical protein
MAEDVLAQPRKEREMREEMGEMKKKKKKKSDRKRASSRCFDS